MGLQLVPGQDTFVEIENPDLNFSFSDSEIEPTIENSESQINDNVGEENQENQSQNSNQSNYNSQLDDQRHMNQVLMNQKKSRKQALKEHHEELQRRDPVYQSAVLFDPNVKNYNKTQLKSVLTRKRKRIDFVTKQNIIRERFQEIGSLQEKANALSIKKIAKTFFVNDRTVTSIINRLKAWAAFSLNKRCALINQELGKKISRFTLAKYYKKNNVKYIKPDYTIHTDQRDQDIHNSRLLFIPQLLECYKKNIEIVYIDECTTNVWQKPSKVWLPKKKPFKIKLATQRGEGITIIGAITSMKKCLFYYLCDGSTTEHIKFFFKGLDRSIQLKDKLIVLDNLSAHKNELVLESLHQFGAKILFLPVATSFFNPIETIWAWVKMQWKNRLLDPQFTSQNPDIIFLAKSLTYICDNIPGEIVQNIAGHTFKIMREYMRNAGVFKYHGNAEQEGNERSNINQEEASE